MGSAHLNPDDYEDDRFDRPNIFALASVISAGLAVTLMPCTCGCLGVLVLPLGVLVSTGAVVLAYAGHHQAEATGRGAALNAWAVRLSLAAAAIWTIPSASAAALIVFMYVDSL